MAELLEIDRRSTEKPLGTAGYPSPCSQTQILLLLALNSLNQDTLFVCKQTEKLTYMLNKDTI